MMPYKSTVVFALILIAPILRAQTTSATRARAVQDARAVYEAVERAVAERQLARHDTTVTCPKDDLEARGTVYVDRRGRIRRLDTQGGSGDHGESVATYFDTLGRARFAFAQRGAVNGTEQEERVYFDARGRVARRVLKQIKGPGYSFNRLRRAPRAASWVRDLCS